MIECLFLLIGAFTYNPANPWAWINDKKNYPGKIAPYIKRGKFEELYKNLEDAGVKSLEEHIEYMFYNVPTIPEWRGKIKTMIEPTIYALEKIQFEFFDKRDLYNAYKHGAITMPVDMMFTISGNSGKKEVLVKPFQALMYVPKGGKKSTLEQLKVLEFHSFLDPVPDYMPLNYEREKKIGKVILSLIQNLINVRKALFVKRASQVRVIQLPSIQELKEIFARPVLYMEKISLDEYKKSLNF